MADKARLVELNRELHKIRKKIASVEDDKTHEQKKLLKIEEAIDELQSKKSEVDSGMEGTIKELQSRISRIDEKNMFTDSYCERVKRILYGARYQEAVEEIRKGIRECTNDYNKCEDNINRLKTQIRKLEQQATALMRQIEEEERSVS